MPVSMLKIIKIDDDTWSLVKYIVMCEQWTIQNETNIIEGIILASIGSIILIKRDGNVYAVDLKKLTGWLVDVDVNWI